MIYKQFQSMKLSQLGFGMMRLPVRTDGEIDQEQVNSMVDYALSHGVNYFDTAYPYMKGKSEISAGIALTRHPRDSYYLATKYPGHQIAETYEPSKTFEQQLKKCQVDYFDFYLLHNVNENSMKVYMDPSLGIVDYFVEQRRLGRIRHLGFSCHARLENLKVFLDRYGDKMEFCQIQLNYLDWTLQQGREKVALLTERGIPVWVMEPVRGGRLSTLSDSQTAKLKEYRPNETVSSWGFRWLQQIPAVTMILSGMSNMAQMEDNVKTFSSGKPLSTEESDLLLKIAECLKDSLPCTGCRYCCDTCPQQLDIPMLIRTYNEARFAGSMIISMMMDALPPEKLPSACLKCGACLQACPQHIDVPAAMADFTERLKQMPKWADICRQRAEEAKRI